MPITDCQLLSNATSFSDAFAAVRVSLEPFQVKIQPHVYRVKATRTSPTMLVPFAHPARLDFLPLYNGTRA